MGDLIAMRTRSEPASPRPASPRPAAAEPLWREVVGRTLREERGRQGRTLADVAERSGVSLPYVSEVERGLKEPSSEVLGAVAGALGLRLVDLTARVTRELAAPTRVTGPLALAA